MQTDSVLDDPPEELELPTGPTARPYQAVPPVVFTKEKSPALYSAPVHDWLRTIDPHLVARTVSIESLKEDSMSSSQHHAPPGIPKERSPHSITNSQKIAIVVVASMLEMTVLLVVVATTSPLGAAIVTLIATLSAVVSTLWLAHLLRVVPSQNQL
jgi:hypothetical protein